MSKINWLFEVVNFVATTRRWYDRGNPRDAGEATPAKQPDIINRFE